MSVSNIVNNWLSKYNQNSPPILSKPVSVSQESILDIPYDDKRIINFKIIKAIGGQIVEVSKYIEDTSSTNSKYNPDNLKRVHNLYIVADGEDLTESLGRIVTMESLR